MGPKYTNLAHRAIFELPQPSGTGLRLERIDTPSVYRRMTVCGSKVFMGTC